MPEPKPKAAAKPAPAPEPEPEPALESLYPDFRADGTIVVPVPGDDPPRTVTLRVPIMSEVRDLFNRYVDADTEHDALEAGPERNRATVDPERSPYAKAFVWAVELLSGEKVDPGHLPLWASSNTMLGQMRRHWAAPLPGALVGAMQETVDQLVAAAQRPNGSATPTPAATPRG
jgi:hypothetical protein